MWPFTIPDVPSKEMLREKLNEINKLRDELHKTKDRKTKVILGYKLTEFADLLRNAEHFEQALHQCDNAIKLGQELEDEELIFVSEMTRGTVEARSGLTDQAMRTMENLISQADENENLKKYLDTLLIHRAGLFHAYGQTGLATKELDHALMVRKERTNEIDPEILEFRNRLLLMDEELQRKEEKNQ